MREAMETKMLTLRRRTRAIGFLSGWPFGLLKDPSVASRLVGYRSTWSSKLGLIGPRARKSYYGHVQNHQLRSQETQRGKPLSKRRYRTVSMGPSVHLELSKKVQRSSVESRSSLFACRKDEACIGLGPRNAGGLNRARKRNNDGEEEAQ